MFAHVSIDLFIGTNKLVAFEEAVYGIYLFLNQQRCQEELLKWISETKW